MKPIAAFDFDGTITYRDTLLGFLRELVGDGPLLAAALTDLPRMVLSATGKGDRDAAKARLFRKVLRGRDINQVQQVAGAHADRVLATELRPDVEKRIEWHRDLGHELVIVSASLDVYLDIIGPRLGFDSVICTKLEISDGKLTGEVVGGNCRAAMKVARLRAAVPSFDEREVWAYGDSAGDNELLAAATHPHRVGGRTILTTIPVGPDPN